MALSSASLFRHPLAISTLTRRPLASSFHHHNHHRRRRHQFPPTFASLNSSSSQPPAATGENSLSSKTHHQQPNPLVESSRPHDPGSFNYALANPNGHSLPGFARSTESNIEKAIFDFRFLALFAIGGSLAGSLLCFLNGCVYIAEAYKVYWSSCVKGIHTGNMVLRLVEAIDVYLAGTVMLIFGMGLYGLFISNSNPELPADVDRALKGSSLFGMFAMKERPKWMKISSLDELKTKVGHVIVMILLVKMFERSKMVAINTGMDLLSYSERLKNQILELTSSARQMRQQQKEKEQSLGQMKTDLRNCVNGLNDMENTKTKCLHALKRFGAEKIFDAYQWLESHRDELNKEVYGPVLLEVNLHANFLEGQVAHYIWKSFITQDSSDRDFLVKHLKSFDVPVLNYVREESGRKAPFEISKQMRELGIYSRLDQVFDAPTAVKEYIGSDKTDKKADDIAKGLGILDFWTPQNHYHWSVSRYGDNEMSGRVEPVHDSRLLLCEGGEIEKLRSRKNELEKSVLCGLDSGEIEKLRSRKNELEKSVADVEEGIKSLQIQRRQVEDEEAKLQKQREEIIDTGRRELKKRKELESCVEQRKRKLVSLEKGGDIETAVAKLVDQAERSNVQRLKHATEVKDLLVEAVSWKWRYAEKHMVSIEIDAKVFPTYTKVATESGIQRGL